MVSDVLRSERDPVMRQLALDALGKTGGLVYAETLYDYMQPRTEADPAVREKAWQVFRAALPRATDGQLANAAGMFKTDPDRHVHVARAMAERFQQRGVLNEWAMQQQNIADDLMKAKGTPQQPGPFQAEAADHYERALKYWVQNKGEALTIDELTRKVVDARLQAGQWQQATAFAQSAIAREGAQAQEVVGPRIKNHADELRKTDRQGALALIDAALRMNPPLDKRHQDDLRTLRSDVAADGSTVPGQQ
jgi:hypothetical protein